MVDRESPAITLLTAQGRAREAVRGQWRKDAGDLLHAHEAAFSALAKMIDRFSLRRFPQQAEALEGRMSLTAQFVQGIDVCEVAIAEGLYAQAAGLLKQEMETIAAVDEFATGRRRDGKTPNIGNGRLTGFGPVYGDLNKIAHVSKHDLARHLVTIEHGEICGPSLLPQYRRELARLLYGWHVFFIIQTAWQVEAVFQELIGEGLSEEERTWLVSATLILLREKAIALPPDAQAEFLRLTGEPEPTMEKGPLSRDSSTAF